MLVPSDFTQKGFELGWIELSWELLRNTGIIPIVVMRKKTSDSGAKESEL